MSDWILLCEPRRGAPGDIQEKKYSKKGPRTQGQRTRGSLAEWKGKAAGAGGGGGGGRKKKKKRPGGGGGGGRGAHTPTPGRPQKENRHTSAMRLRVHWGQTLTHRGITKMISSLSGLQNLVKGDTVSCMKKVLPIENSHLQS